MRAKFVTIEVASARNIADRWLAGRRRDGEWVRDMDAGIYESLRALGDLPDIDKAADIIGNKSWTHISCDGCSDTVLRGVRIGEWCEGKTYCATCIAEAHQILAT